MRLDDIRTPIEFELWLVPIGGASELANGIVGFESSGTAGQYHVIQSETLVPVQLKNKHQQNNINFHLARGCAKLACVTQTAKDGSVLLKVNFFNGPLIEIGEPEIVIDDRIKEAAEDKGFRFDSTEELASVLRYKSVIETGDPEGEVYFQLTAGEAADEDFDSSDGTPSEADDETEARPDGVGRVEGRLRCFSLIGDNLRIPVERRRIEGGTEKLFATRLICRANDPTDGAVRLARGKVKYSDYTQTGRIQALVSGSMSRLYQGRGSYLKRWDEYGAIEGEMLLSRARSIGRLQYSDGHEVPGKGVKFFFKEQLPDDLLADDELELVSKDPIYLREPGMTWDQYSKYLEGQFSRKGDGQGKDADADDSDETCVARIVSIESSSLVLDLPAPPSEKRSLILSINGDKIQILRRMQARKLILEGRSANPLLGLLIEEEAEIPDIRRTTRIKGLTWYVREKIFKNEPTDVQEEAIEMALNTPDIAMIQGPPGTGKTTVITAILERLNEEHDKTRSVRGEILVSGFQHDAVRNIISRLSINSLPTVKYGRKVGNSTFTEDSVSERIELWCREVAEKIRENDPKIVQAEGQRELAELFNLYMLSPSCKNGLNLIDQVLQIPRSTLSPDLVEKATLLRASIQSEMDLRERRNVDLLNAIRAIRVSQLGFADDGRERVADVLAYADETDSSDKAVLMRALESKDQDKSRLLRELREVKFRLLQRHTPKPQYRIEKPRSDVFDLLARVMTQMRKSQTGQNSVDTVLANFLHELEDNPDGVREAIGDYNYVFAATVQQAAGKAIRAAKKQDDDKSLKYDTVVIDEAARTSPRDLLIPMAQAEKRIILVGDHRQLPHLIDREVARQLECGEDPLEWEESMFEYLFRRMKGLEKKDEQKRTITLDAQYRMHSLLGDFVSRNFYEPDDEGFKSPLRDQDEILFSHNLPGSDNRPAMCIDVSCDNRPKRIGTSWSRRAEATAIARQLAGWIDTEEGRQLTFGIISFYNAQTSAIHTALEESGISQDQQVTAAYKWLEGTVAGQPEERLRIGTVDSFQGMEFDVVFLSMVRSVDTDKPPRYIERQTDPKKRQRAIFGHLMSPKRLCVSMSRQKRLLVLVGDMTLLQTDIAGQAVPALQNYYELCLRKGRVL